jgi:hypothetical protein
LLAADPRHQGLELWLAEFPQPRPPRETWSQNPVFQQLDAQFSKAHAENPDYTGLHYMTADEVEECWQLLRQSLHSVSYETLAHLPTYSQWLSRQDWTKPYRRHRKNLQLIGLNDPEKQWVLKNPSHLVGLDAIMSVYPDALIVYTHREPVVAIASACSLSAEATRGWSDVFTGDVIGRTQLDMLARAHECFESARATYPVEQFVDVEYDDFTVDPLGTVQQIYETFSLHWTDEVAATVTAIDAESRQGGRRPAHRYSLADYGLTEEQVKEQFDGL